MAKFVLRKSDLAVELSPNVVLIWLALIVKQRYKCTTHGRQTNLIMTQNREIPKYRISRFYPTRRSRYFYFRNTTCMAYLLHTLINGHITNVQNFNQISCGKQADMPFQKTKKSDPPIMRIHQMTPTTIESKEKVSIENFPL